MIFKKAIDLTSLTKSAQKQLENIDPIAKLTNSGIAGDSLIDPSPSFLKTPSEKVVEKGNSSIVLGRDRVGSRMSGYGGLGDTHCSSIDIVVGRQGFEARKVSSTGQQLWVDPSFKKDAARIYLSQKTDIDAAFGLTDGKVGHSKTKSAIGLKADGIRIVAREGIKLITRTDIRNSQGGKVDTINGIDIIAGNDTESLQPMAKGENLVEALERMVTHIDKLNGIVDGFMMSQFELNEAITTHYHNSPFFAAPTAPSTVLIPKGVKNAIELLTKVKRSLVSHKANLASFKITYLTPMGKKYILSRFNNVN